MAQVMWKEMRILIAEDEPDLREILATIFECEGSQVVCAEDGVEALRIINSQPIDLVVSDIRMPKCDGIQLLENLRQKSPDQPIVFLATGFADITREIAKEKGAADLINKPFAVPDLLSMIEKHLTALRKFTKQVA